MNIDETKLRLIIRRAVEQVIRRLYEQENTETGALALVPSYVADTKPLISYLKEKYAGELTLAGEGTAALQTGFKVLEMQSQQDKSALMASLKSYADILLITPPLWLMKNISGGDDRGFYEQAFMRALLWGKNVSVVIDYEKPKFSRGTFFESINDSLSAIEEMGAKVVSLKLSVGKPEGRLSLVTQDEITCAHRRGQKRVVCEPGAIVTPLARDAAKELGVEIYE